MPIAVASVSFALSALAIVQRAAADGGRSAAAPMSLDQEDISMSISAKSKYIYNSNIMPKCTVPSRYGVVGPCVNPEKRMKCGHMTTPGETEWKLYGLSALYLDVNTTSCNFPSTPVYITNINGNTKGGQWQLTGTNSIYRLNKNMFRVLLSHPSIRGDELWRHAMSHKWFLSWIGVMGSYSGTTKWGATDWKQHGKNSLMLDIDTIPAVFTKVPRYFTSLVGERMHWKVTGTHLIYKPLRGSFRVYLFEAGANLTPAMANGYKWSVLWVGDQGKSSGHTAHGLWEKDSDTNTWLVKVDTSEAGFKEVPAYVTSLASEPYVKDMLMVNGAGALFNPTSTSFELYLDNDKTNSVGESLHTIHEWTVNYLGFAPKTDCEVSDWSGWTRCSKKCGGGKTSRARKILAQPYGEGAKPCPDLKIEKACNEAVCPTPQPTRMPTGQPTTTPTLGPVDCKASDWSAWTQCDKKCGWGSSFRNRTIFTHSARGGKACPSQLKQYHACNKKQCIGEGKQKTCGATVPTNLMKWKMFGQDGLYFDVYTGYCKFTTTPQYISNLVGSAKHWQVTGTNSVSDETPTSFRVILVHPHLKGLKLLHTAQNNKWQINWIANAGPNTGITDAGHTKWIASPEDNLSVFVDVKTTSCNYVATPRYFPAIHGAFEHYRTEGSHIVYLASRTGFRIYVVYGSPITPAKANLNKWRISWVGYETDFSRVGRSTSLWVKTENGKGLSINVDTTVNNYKNVPTLGTSIHATHLHWRVSGGASVYKVTETSFRLYLDKAINPLFANKYHWAVNYVGYDGPVDCEFSDWSPWSPCTKICLGGTHNRTRFLALEPYHGGKACPAVPQVMESRACNTGACPTPAPTPQPTTKPTISPTPAPTPPPSLTPTPAPTLTPTIGPTPPPSLSPTPLPTKYPTPQPSPKPTPAPTPLIQLDCVVSSWTKWTKCSKRCFGGTQTKNRIVLQAPREGAPGRPPPKKCPKLKMERYCNQGPCVGEGESRICGTKTLEPPYGKTAWQALGTRALYLDVDTSFCNFTGSPRYATNLIGASAFYWRMTGNSYLDVHNYNRTAFRLVVWHPLLQATRLLAYAKRYEWRVSWIGDAGSSSGMTQPGLTGWNIDSTAAESNYLHVDVDCSANKYKSTPRYFVSVGGKAGHFGVQTASIVYHPKKKGFRTFIMYKDPVSPVMAEKFQWSVSWIGVEKTDSRSGTVGHGWLASQTQDWKVDASGHGMLMNVDTRMNKFDKLITPTYVTSVSYTGNLQWKLTGAKNIFDVKPSGFRVYLGKAQGVAKMTKHAWQFMDKKYFLVNYLGYEDERPRECVTSRWSLWSLCTKTCGGATKLRTRTIIKHPMFKGTPCPKLRETQACNTKACPIDCEVSKWSDWGQCSLPCGGGLQYRTRKVTRYAKSGGKKCSKDLKAHRSCNDNYCIGIGGSHFCGDTTKADATGHTNWKLFGTAGLYVDIDTSQCAFRTTAYYVIAVYAEAGHWDLAGTESITSPTKNSFRVILVHPTARGHDLLALAKSYRWRVGWIGDTGSNAGVTVPGFTGWKEITFVQDEIVVASTHTVYADVDVKSCGFDDKTYYHFRPRYITSVVGDKNHWRVRGAHIVYNPSRTKFRIYATYDRYITAAQAEHFKWTVSWIGTTEKHSGTQTTHWKDSTIGLYMDVSTSESGFIKNHPTYIAAFEAARVEWKATDKWMVGGLFDIKAASFRIYLDRAHNATIIKDGEWAVNYLGYQGKVDCELSKWSDWSMCKCGLGKNFQERKRTILQKPSTWGKACSHDLVEQKYCFRVCPSGTKLAEPARVEKQLLQSNTTQRVTLSTQINGETRKTFVTAKQLIVRVGLGQAIGISSNQIQIVDIRDATTFPTGSGGRRRLGATQEDGLELEHKRAGERRLVAAKDYKHSVIIDFKILVSTLAASEAIVAEVEAPTFSALFAAELTKFGLKLDASDVTVSNPVVRALHPQKRVAHHAVAKPKGPPKVMFQQARKVFFAFVAFMMFILVILAARMAGKRIFAKDRGNRNQQDDVHMQETMPLSGGHSSGYNPEQDIVVVGQFEQDVGAEYGETI